MQRVSASWRRCFPHARSSQHVPQPHSKRAFSSFLNTFPCSTPPEPHVCPFAVLSLQRCVAPAGARLCQLPAQPQQLQAGGLSPLPQTQLRDRSTAQ